MTESRPGFTRLALLACVLLPILVYAAGLRSPFAFRDLPDIVENPDLKAGADRLWDKIRSPDSGDPRAVAERARPVPFLTLALNYGFGRLVPLGYRAFNLGVHILVTVLIFLLSRRIFWTVLESPPAEDERKKAPPAPRTGLAASFAEREGFSGSLALCTALLFAVHPIHSEVVLSASGRADGLAALFSLLALLAFVKTAENAGPIWPVLYGAGTLLAFCSGPSAAALPPAVLLFDFAFLSGLDAGRLRGRWRLHLLVWLVAAAFFALSAALPGELAAWLGFSRAWNPVDYAATQAYSFLNYLAILILPLRQSVDHGVAPPKSLMDAHIFFSIAGLAGLVLFLYHLYRTSKPGAARLVLFSSAWFFLALLPTAVLPLSDALVEGRVYLAAWGFCLGLVLFYLFLFDIPLRSEGRKSPLRPRLGAFAAVVLLHIGLLSAATVRRDFLYRHPERLWVEAIHSHPGNPRAYYNLGRAFQDERQYQAALSAYKKALELDPKYSEAYDRMSSIYSVTKDTAAAKNFYDKAVAAAPNSALLHFNQGIAAYTAKNYAGAEESYLKAVELDPKFYKAYNNLAVVYTHLGQYDKALEACRKSLEIDPDYGAAHFNLGNVYSKLKDYPRALQEFKAALKFLPDNATVQGKVAETERLVAKPVTKM